VSSGKSKPPTRRTDELWVLTTFFNPVGYPNKLENFTKFSERIRKQGVKLLTVELAFEGGEFEVPAALTDRLERRRTSTVLWHKERLLDIGLRLLPPECTKVAWLDADVVFENNDWLQETSALLDSYVVVQPFETACWLPKGATSAVGVFSVCGNQEGQYMPGMACAMSKATDKRAALGDYFQHGHTGFGWAARRDLLDKHGFYDCQILGNGDFVMGHAMYGDEDFWDGRNWECQRLSPKLLEHIVAWSKPFHEDVQSSVYYASGRVLHLWHGDQKNRRYNERLNVLKDHQFDPRTDLAKDTGECWVWSSDKPGLHQWARDYFLSRDEN